MKSNLLNLISGAIPVYQTPFHIDDTVDYGTLEAGIYWLFVLDSETRSEVDRLFDLLLSAVENCR